MPLATGGNISQVTVGGTIYNVHTFTTSGNISFTVGGTVEVLLVAGGGAGGSAIGGGGGGGGVIYMPSVTVSTTSYTITVGAGGTPAAATSGVVSGSGSNSTAFGATAAGGGGSGTHDVGDGVAGGSGGGAASNNSRLNQGGASSGNSLGGNTGTIYGNRGGNMTTARTGTPTVAAGGGGAGAAALDTNPNTTGASAYNGEASGGIGMQSAINGTNYYWGGGGGGGAHQSRAGGYGGFGGGGGGSSNGGGGGLGGTGGLNNGATPGNDSNGGAGGANTGGGGGGAAWQTYAGGAGGSGIVIVRYSTTITDSKGGYGNIYAGGGGGAAISYQSTTTVSVIALFEGSLGTPGLAGKFFNGDWRSTISTGNIGTLPLTTVNDSSNVTGTTGLPSAAHRYGVNIWPSISYGDSIGDTYGFIAIGYFKPPTTGTYSFYTTSDDSSGVWVGNIASNIGGRTTTNATVNNNMGTGQGATRVNGSISLTANVWYPIRIVHEEGTGGDSLTFGWSGPGITETTSLTTYFRTPVFANGTPTGTWISGSDTTTTITYGLGGRGGSGSVLEAGYDGYLGGAGGGGSSNTRAGGGGGVDLLGIGVTGRGGNVDLDGGGGSGNVVIGPATIGGRPGFNGNGGAYGGGGGGGKVASLDTSFGWGGNGALAIIYGTTSEVSAYSYPVLFPVTSSNSVSELFANTTSTLSSLNKTATYGLSSVNVLNQSNYISSLTTGKNSEFPPNAGQITVTRSRISSTDFINGGTSVIVNYLPEFMIVNSDPQFVANYNQAYNYQSIQSVTNINDPRLAKLPVEYIVKDITGFVQYDPQNVYP